MISKRSILKGLGFCAALAGLMVWMGCEQAADEAPDDKGMSKTVASPTALEAALSNPDVKEITITGDINGGESLDVTVKGNKTIYISDGVQTEIRSLKLAEGSQVAIKPASVQSSRAAAAGQRTYGFAILVIWNYFEIPTGATFDLIDMVQLIFRTTVATVKVDGTLKAGMVGAIAVEAGGTALEITGSGTVTVDGTLEKKAGDKGWEIDIEVSYTPPVSDDTDSDSAPPVKTATEKLENDLNGSETTVTLAGDLVMDRDLTVPMQKTLVIPAGITLTVSGGPALAAAGGRTLTIAGTLIIDGSIEGSPSAKIVVLATGNVAGANAVIFVPGVTYTWPGNGGIWQPSGGKPLTWTAVTIDTFLEYANYINGIAYGNGTFVVAGGLGKAAYSTDGVKWTGVDDTKSDLNSFVSIRGIAYGDSKFVVGGVHGHMAYSTNGGVTWTAVAAPQFGSSSINGIAYGGDRFVAVGNDGKAAYSEDGGVTWTPCGDTKFGSYDIDAIAYGGGKFVAAGEDGKAAYSEDGGVTWTPCGDTKLDASDIAYGGGKFVAVGEDGIAYSANGATWTEVPNVKKTIFDWAWIYGIAYGGGRFVAVANVGKAAYSTDGVTWTPCGDTELDASDIAYGGGKFVAVGSDRKVAYSNNQE